VWQLAIVVEQGFHGLTTSAGRAEWITSLPTKPDDI
jgi:hypothetical protein